MIITFWDHETGSWQTGDSVFDGKVLPGNADDHRFWAQREALLGQGNLERGKHLSKADMRKAKNVLPADSGVWSRSPVREIKYR